MFRREAQLPVDLAFGTSFDNFSPRIHRLLKKEFENSVWGPSDAQGQWNKKLWPQSNRRLATWGQSIEKESHCSWETQTSWALEVETLYCLQTTARIAGLSNPPRREGGPIKDMALESSLAYSRGSLDVPTNWCQTHSYSFLQTLSTYSASKYCTN